MTGNGSPPRVS